MKKLFCVVVTDPEYVIGLDSPIIFHVKCETSEQAEEFAVNDLSSEEDFGYDPELIGDLDIFSYEVTELDINEI